jgi:hypothetical protein
MARNALAEMAGAEQNGLGKASNLQPHDTLATHVFEIVAEKLRTCPDEFDLRRSACCLSGRAWSDTTSSWELGTVRQAPDCVVAGAKVTGRALARVGRSDSTDWRPKAKHLFAQKFKFFAATEAMR